MIEYNTANSTHNYNSMKPCGDKVLLKKLINTLNKKYGDILIPQEHMKNQSFGVAQVVDLGSSYSIKDSGIKIGDYVLYDYFSVYNDNPEYVLTKIENIILQLSEDEALKYKNTYNIWN
jgi:co-chaperonin GroES (HSP10)